MTDLITESLKLRQNPMDKFEKVIFRHMQKGHAMWDVYGDVCMAYEYDGGPAVRESALDKTILHAVLQREATQHEAEAFYSEYDGPYSESRRSPNILDKV